MSNYIGRHRTNYFRVEDEAQFRAFMAPYTKEHEIEIWDKEDIEGNKRFAFGGHVDPPIHEDDEFVPGLQACLAQDDAVIITEIGYEKLNYLVASAFIVTKDKMEDVDLWREAVDKAMGMLVDDGWETQTEY